MLAFQSNENVEKKKKKLTEFQRKIFYEALYYRGLENYCKVMMRLTQALTAKSMLKTDENDERQASRFELRMKMIERALFIRKLSYEEFKKGRDDVNNMEVI
jgi:hypothetical protein